MAEGAALQCGCGGGVGGGGEVKEVVTGLLVLVFLGRAVDLMNFDIIADRRTRDSCIPVVVLVGDR